MACQGPTAPSDERVDEAMDMIMELLKEHFDVLDPVVHPSYLKVHAQTGELIPPSGSWITVRPSDEHWYTAQKALRRAVAEMLFAQACIDW